MDHGLCPGAARIRQFVRDATSSLATARPAGHRCPIKITLRIERHAFVRFTAICAAGETVEHGVHPTVCRRRYLENRAAAKSTAKHGRAVQVAGTIDCKIGIGVFTILLAAQTVDHVRRRRARETDSSKEHKTPPLNRSIHVNTRLCILDAVNEEKRRTRNIGLWPSMSALNSKFVGGRCAFGVSAEGLSAKELLKGLVIW